MAKHDFMERKQEESGSTAEGGPISFSTCLSAEINIVISSPTHARTRPKMNEMLGLNESCLVANYIF